MSSKLNLLILFLSIGLLSSCGENKEKEDLEKIGHSNSTVTEAAISENADPLQNKGIGPVTNLSLGALDADHAARGKVVFENMCTACHKWDKKFVGPALTGITERRSPEWIMNM